MSYHVYPTISEEDTIESVLRNFSSSGCTESGGYTDTNPQTFVTSVRRMYAAGERTPGFRKMANAGVLLPMNRWDQYIFNGTVSEGARSWCSGVGNKRKKYINYYPGGSFLQYYAADGTLMALVDPFDLEYLVQKAAAGIVSSGWDILTFLAEIKQLRRMFSEIVRKFDSLTRELTKRDFRGKKLRRNLRLASNWWLEGRYGWRTLRYDIVDLHQAIMSANDRLTRYRHSSGDSVGGSFTDYTESESSGIIQGVSESISWTGSLRGTVVADIEVPKLRINPVATAWEVTKLSFVIDWLFNVGQSIDATTFLFFAKDYRACAGYKFEFELEKAYTLVGTTGSTNNASNIGYVSGKASVTKRIPSSVSALPRLKVRMDPWKALDLLTLVAQRLL